MAGGRGPQGRRHMTVSQAMKAAGSGNLNRVIRMIFGMYGGTLLAVVFFIAVAAVADVRGTLFLRGLIDDYIIPMTKTADPDFGPLFRALRS
ncbi:MAG: ABC transporter ATP-binding protein, partial [Stomatobaculum sp.]|nr:ABC transporter ATP-binding protein [Stomatobaculum sp.]